ncbi:acyl-CoA dehydrogenase [Actinomadura sp. KC06]|uniref:acyl-CoA dehydrogenase n=1 Tax=Actinomadura sp. KC06 TaxID=2530369 RepID=UPI001048352F|nr:acyl-CoA dehydrogenase [Actinomadura sp. KC06]TDD40127.1 acyl-CoA dehydrogenase [Actinomadura sp. KC06]
MTHATATPAPETGSAGPGELEALLGDPLDPANPLGHAAVLAADERGEILAAGEDALDAYGLNAEFVPRPLGGRFERADRLAETVRAVFRRDVTLGLGYGITNFVAAAPVWASGNPEQQAWLARLLLRNRRAAAAYTELPHGNDFTRNELTALPSARGFTVDGRKELVNNVGRADAVVLFARTDDGPGSRSHSHLLVDMTALPADRRTYLPRFPTVGVRGCLLGGVEFTDCPVPGDSLLGERGGAMETVLKAFQVTRAVLPGVVIGALDTQLRTATDFARHRVLYGGTVADLPNARATLVGAFVDLLICDALATVGARALHLRPAETSVLTAAVKFLVPKILREASYALSVLVGARSYLRDGPYAIFEKTMRDLPLVTFAHANAAVCQATIIPQLPRLAARSWLRADPPPDALFDTRAELPPLDFGGLAINARGADGLSAMLAVAAGDADPRVAEPGARLVAELDRLRRACLDLPARDRTALAGRAAFDLCERYIVLLGAAACVGVRRHATGFLAGPDWITGALARLEARLGRRARLPEGTEARLAAELFGRADDHLTFDLYARRLAG